MPHNSARAITAGHLDATSLKSISNDLCVEGSLGKVESLNGPAICLTISNRRHILVCYLHP